MKKNSFLKNQLNDFVDVYDNSLIKTSGITILLSVFTVISFAFLLKYSNFDSSSTKKQISLLSYFFYKYSEGTVYSLVDLSKNVFVFFVSIFSIIMIRMNNSQTDSNEANVNSFSKYLYFIDVIYLLGIFILCSTFDYLFFQLDILLITIRDSSLNTWTQNVDTYLLRPYIPLILFSITIYWITKDSKTRITIKSVFYLCLSLWMINEFMYELFIFIRTYIYGFILAPFDQENKFLYESVLGVFLIALSFLGYYSAMTKSLILGGNKE